MADIKEITTNISFNKLAETLNDNFDALVSVDESLSNRISTYENSEILTNFMKGNLSAQSCVFSNTKFNVGSRPSGNSIELTAKGIILKSSNNDVSSDSEAFLFKVDGGSNINLNETTIGDGRLLIFVLGEMSQDGTGYNSTITYRGYGNNEDTSYQLSVAQPSLVLLCTTSGGTDNQKSFIRIGGGNGSGTNVDSQIAALQAAINANTKNIAGLKESTDTSIKNLSTSISTIEVTANEAKSTAEDVAGEYDADKSQNNLVQKRHVVDGWTGADGTIPTVSYVNDLVVKNLGRYITKNTNGDAFDTAASLKTTTTFYYGGVATTVSPNDTCIVKDNGEGKTAKFIYVKPQGGTGSWEQLYVISTTAFTDVELAALHSGITSSILDTLTGSLFGEDGYYYIGDGLVYNSTTKTISSIVTVTGDKPYVKIGSTNKEIITSDGLSEIEGDIDDLQASVDSLEDRVDDLESSLGSNIVTIDDNQTITGKKTFTNDVNIVDSKISIKSNESSSNSFLEIDESGNLLITAKGIGLTSTLGDSRGPVTITNIATPVNSSDAVNKGYVDSHASQELTLGWVTIDSSKKISFTSQIDSYDHSSICTVTLVKTTSDGKQYNDRCALLQDVTPTGYIQRLINLPDELVKDIKAADIDISTFDYLQRSYNKTTSVWGDWTVVKCMAGGATIDTITEAEIRALFE